LKDIPQSLIAYRSAVASQHDAVERGPSRFREDFARRDERPSVPEELVFAGGERVRHPRFGEGVVVGSQMVKDDQEVTVAFKGDIGIKKLMLSFAPLEKL
jgi:DNA helicase-2/ATP-dependent DNA helicase PcrA